MAIELATAYVSLVASGRGIAKSIATELGGPLERAAKITGQRVSDVIGREVSSGAKESGAEAGDSLTDAFRRSVNSLGGLEAPDIKAPSTDDMEMAVVAAAKRAAKKAAAELSLTPGLDAAQFEAKVAAAATAAAAKARAQFANIPAGIDVSALESQAASAAAKATSKLSSIEIRDIAAPKIGQPEIPEADASGLLSGAKKAGLAAGAAAGAGLTIGFTSNLGAEVSNDRLAAQLGISDPAFAKDLGRTAGRIYAGAWGESIGEVNAALRSVIQNSLVDPDATTDDIEAITVKVLDLATAFEQDLGGASKAAGQLIKTGMAANADEALDIIVKGFQSGVDRSEDFLDTITEYGTQFRKLGIDGPKALGLLSQGLRGGARDADVVADAIKEFSIRAVDGSELTADGFRTIGLEAETMAAQIGAGGDSAAAGLDVVLDRVRAIPDPVVRAQAAVALFGTQAEDLGDALFALDPSTAVAGLGEIEGAAESMGATLNDNATTAFESFKRRTEVALGGVAGALGQVLDVAPALGGLALTASAVGPHLGTAATGIAGVVRSGAGFVGSIGPMPGLLKSTSISGAGAGKALLGVAGTAAGLYAVTKGLQAIGGSANDASVDIDRMATATGEELVAAFRKAQSYGIDDKAFALILDESVSEAQRLVDALAAVGIETGKYQSAVDRAVAGQRAAIGAKEKDAQITGSLAGATADLGGELGKVTSGIDGQADAFGGATKEIETYEAAMNRILGVHVSAERAAIDYAAAHHNLAASVAENGRTLDLGTEAGRANREAILSIIDATTDHISAMRDEGATASELQATFATHRGELANVLAQLGLNKAEADRYLGLLDAVPESVLTAVDVNTAPAEKTLRDWREGIARTSFNIPIGIGRLEGRAGGGSVTAGQPYVVGENRPELFVPDTNGTIMPKVPAGVGGGGSPVSLSVSVLREEETPAEIVRSLANLAYLSG